MSSIDLAMAPSGTHAAGEAISRLADIDADKPRACSNTPVSKSKLLVLARYYLPGFRAGGPQRSVANLIAALGDQLDIRVVCLDRDVGARKSYEIIEEREWTPLGAATVAYLPPRLDLPVRILRHLRQRRSGALYLNSFFDPVFSIWPLLAMRLGLAPGGPVVVAPRGEFSAGALSLRPVRKRTFLEIARLLGLHRGVTWHATAETEADDIRRVLGDHPGPIRIVSNLPALGAPAEATLARGASRPLELVFLSRLTRKKNLSGALKALAKVRTPVRLSIMGPKEDGAYWRECERLIEALPPNVEAAYEGEVRHEDVPQRLATKDAFFLPTLGENFGHVIFEALQAGLPVVLSDQTPWRALSEAGVGFDIALNDEAAFAAAIEELALMSDDRFAAMRTKSFEFARRWLGEQDTVSGMLSLLSRGSDDQQPELG